MEKIRERERDDRDLVDHLDACDAIELVDRSVLDLLNWSPSLMLRCNVPCGDQVGTFFSFFRRTWSILFVDRC